MKRWKAWVGVAVSVAAIAWAIRGVEWSLVGPALADADWWVLALVFLLAPVVNVWVRALRWRISLWPVRRLPLSACFSATAIGLFVNNVLPARIGEFVRAYALARRERVPTGTALGGLFLERMFDGFALVGMLWGVTRVVALPPWAETTANVAFWIFVGFLAFQILLVVRPRAVIATAQWIRRRLFGGRFEAGLERALATFIDGFRLLRRPGLLAASAVLAVVQWTLVAGLFWLGMAAFGFATRAGVEGALFTNSVTALGVAAPSSPGFVGTFQALVVKSLEAFRIDRTLAFTYSLGFHAALFVPVTIVGFVAFLRAGLSWKEIEGSERQVEREMAEEFETEIEPSLEPDARG